VKIWRIHQRDAVEGEVVAAAQRDQPRVVLAAARASHVRQVPPTDVLPENRLPAAPVDHAVAHDARVSHAVAIDQRLAAVAFLGDRAADARLQIVVARVREANRYAPRATTSTTPRRNSSGPERNTSVRSDVRSSTTARPAGHASSAAWMRVVSSLPSSSGAIDAAAHPILALRVSQAGGIEGSTTFRVSWAAARTTKQIPQTRLQVPSCRFTDYRLTKPPH